MVQVADRFLYQAFEEGLPAALWVVQLDPRGLMVLHVNRKLCAICAAPAEAIVGRRGGGQNGLTPAGRGARAICNSFHC